jgi:hypothetical protein
LHVHPPCPRAIRARAQDDLAAHPRSILSSMPAALAADARAAAVAAGAVHADATAAATEAKWAELARCAAARRCVHCG